MKKHPKVSVIIPTYNRARLIGRAIRSILNQTFQDFEIIVVDDGSTDNSKDICCSLNDSRLHYIRHEQNRGGGAARNTGIVAAQGEYIAFQDSDDEWLSDKLERQIQILEKASNEVGVVYTAFIRVDGSRVFYLPSFEVVKKEGNILNQLLKGNFVSTQTTMIRMSCFEKVGMFDEMLPRFQDWELFIRISKNYKFKFISEPLAIVYKQDHSITSDQKAYIKALNLIRERHFEEFARSKNLLANLYFNMGLNLFLFGNIKEGRRYMTNAIKTYPFKFKYFIAVLITFFGKNIFHKAFKFYDKMKFAILYSK